MSEVEQQAELDEAAAEKALRMAELAEQRRSGLREQVRRFAEPRADDRVVDLGAGTGSFAFAIAPLVAEVAAVEIVPELVAEGTKHAAAFPNVTFVEGDAAKAQFEGGSFDLAACVRVLHHAPRPELVVAELARLAGLGGRVLVVDQIAPTDPLLGFELDRFERARDPSHRRLLPDVDVQALLEANGLVLRRSEFHQEERDLECYLDLAGCTGDARQRALALAPGAYRATIGWYLASRYPLGR